MAQRQASDAALLEALNTEGYFSAHDAVAVDRRQHLISSLQLAGFPCTAEKIENGLPLGTEPILRAPAIGLDTQRHPLGR